MEKIEKYLNQIFNKISDWFNNLSSIMKLVVCVIGVIVLAFFVSLLSNTRKNYEIINYDNYSVEELLSSSTEVNDRLVFLKSEEIITELFDIYNGNFEIKNEKVKLDDYYDYVLFVDYKYSITKKQFKNNVKNIVEDFYTEYNTKDVRDLKTTSVVDKIYDYTPRNGMYIVKLRTSKEIHYIGIKFSTVNDTYTIFYIE